jgi:hypothetical protein
VRAQVLAVKLPEELQDSLSIAQVVSDECGKVRDLVLDLMLLMS